MKKVKYFQLLERTAEAQSIGVVKADFCLKENGNVEMIKRAIEAHFDEEIENISISDSCAWGNYEISFDFKNNERERETINAIETWLYF